MRIFKIFVAVLFLGLASCQTIPVERKNNCACAWQKTNGWEALPKVERESLA